VQANLIPIFEALAELFRVGLALAIRVVSLLWQNVLLPKLEKVWEWVDNKILPVFAALRDFWDNKFGPIIEKVAGWLGKKLQPAFEGISGVVEGIIGWIQKLIDLLKKIELPDDWTPGSPTPFEIGLRGINEQLKLMAKNSLPRLSAELDLDAPSLPNISGIAGEGGVGETNYYIENHHAAPVQGLSEVEIVKLLQMQYGGA
jgi:hypothetical protein